MDRKTFKGRGALSNPDNRFLGQITEAFFDGWDIPRDEPGRPPTRVIEERCKSIISTNRSPDIPFHYSINPYRGCEHGCTYCYARPTHAYWDLSPGLDFETNIISKPNAAALLRKKLENPRYKPSPISIGANTDPYQPVEAQLGITRSIIEVLHEFQHPFSIITKSNLILRDLDLLMPMAEKNLFSVAVSVTTLDDRLKRILEPRTPRGRVRVDAIRQLSESGINVTLLAAPMIPCINDAELETILEQGKKAGATAARYILLRLPLEISDLFQEWLHEHFPARANKVMSIIRQSRGGRDYRSVFGERMIGTGEFAMLLHNRWRIASRKLGYDTDARFELTTKWFTRHNEQLSLF
ncbi:MAG: PA0069 family radical SAM protein [Pseudomonadales bacterium]|nr:PA0069 family radical SAM protein [Pseudomonadales bacterium]MBO7004350.1 PA0069 family radical SAM protein [Pseudomonadales bacterium]